MTVCCGDCAHFIRSEVHPEQGMGRCAVNAESKPATYTGRAPCLWPFSERICREFK